MDQPADEKAMIVTENAKYPLKKILRGQRNAAAVQGILQSCSGLRLGARWSQP